MRHDSVPGLTPEQSKQVVTDLEGRLIGCLDLQLTLKHIHWNVVGPSFIAVHEVLDEQVEAVRAMADAIAERIATLGGEPNGTPGSIVANRSWQDHHLMRATAAEHLRVLDAVYERAITGHRSAVGSVGDIDPICEDLLIGQTAKLELFQWFFRSHMEGAAT